MNEQQRAIRQKELEDARQTEEHLTSGRLPLSCSKDFREVYGQRPGMLRRRSLVAFFRRYPLAKLAVNNKWQANMVDPDLKKLMKQGILVRIRDGGSKKHPMNRSSSKRQSYLVLAPQQ